MRRVLLCSKSLLISGLQASLGSIPELDLEWVDAQPERIRAKISTCQPQVLIVETGLLQSDLSLALLHEFPQMKIIAVEIEDNRLVVFSGSASCEPSPEDLLQAINR